MAEKDVKLYKFSRGDKYSVIIAIVNGDHVIFDNIITPPGTPLDVVEKMLDHAEKEALLKHRTEVEKWSGS